MKFNFSSTVLIGLVLFAFSTTKNYSQNIANSIDDVKPLMVGQKIPNIDVRSYEGTMKNTKELFKKPTVLVVYRGGWCPYCTAQLRDLQKVESDILKMGYDIVAISPDGVGKGREVVDELDLKYEIYSDGNAKFIKSMGLAYKAPSIMEKLLKKSSEGDNKDNLLPAPAIYIVDKGKVLFSYVNTNYKKRFQVDVMMSILKNI